MSESQVFDLEGALDRVEDDRELYLELVDIFKEEYPAELQALRAGVAGGDAKTIEIKAHSLKSALGNIGGMRAFDAAYDLEVAGRENRLDGAAEALELFEAAVAAFFAACKEAFPNNQKLL